MFYFYLFEILCYVCIQSKSYQRFISISIMIQRDEMIGRMRHHNDHADYIGYCY